MKNDKPDEVIIVLDYGSQTSQLIARRIRDIGVYCELFPWYTPEEKIAQMAPKGIILSGGPNSVYEENAPYLPEYLLNLQIPILGICYGMQLLVYKLGGGVRHTDTSEYGPSTITLDIKNELWDSIPHETDVWMSHNDSIQLLPTTFTVLAHSSNNKVAAIGNIDQKLYGIQFHPEVTHTLCGTKMLENFAIKICKCKIGWSPEKYIEETVEKIRNLIGNDKVILGLSGGVDSSVAASLIQRAIGDNLICIFVDNGLLRHEEAFQVINTFKNSTQFNIVAVNATEEFLEGLKNVSDPEEKRRRIGEIFIRIFEKEAELLSQKLGPIKYLAQGTIYPDVIESASRDRPGAHKIKTHHNVGGLPDNMAFSLLEPLRFLFKDEVRRIGEILGVPKNILYRHPFPGPGLAIRCLGEITWERLETLRKADAIFLDELAKADLMLKGTSQAFAVLLPVKSVGVMGDTRTYKETIVLRAVTTDNFMTADWSRIPLEILAKVSTRIVNEVIDVNRVVYDITTKPPATIEWE